MKKQKFADAIPALRDLLAMWAACLILAAFNMWWLHGLLDVWWLPSTMSWKAFFWVSIITPIYETVLWVTLPVAIAKKFPDLMWPLLLCSASVFGFYWHGEYFPAIFVQGVMGGGVFWLYYKHNFITGAALHALWNLSMGLLPVFYK